jgi:hypothetical protein
MPRSGAPQWKKLKEPILDHLLHASVNQAGGKHNKEGHYAELVYAGCETKERALEIKRALFRAGKRTGHSVSAKVLRNGNVYDVHFKAIDKIHAKKYVMDHYGADRTKWPYSPFKRDPNYDAPGADHVRDQEN